VYLSFAGHVDPQLDQRLVAPLDRDQAQRLLVHRALEQQRSAGDLLQ
jgi:hypothetical protein